MKTVALFGGSFDPPHIGHEHIVQRALEVEFIDKVIVMPTYLNPFKSQFHAPAEVRLQWLREIFSSYKNVEVSDFEVKLQRKVPSIESVHFLLEKYKKVYLIIGADNLSSLSQWENYETLQQLVTFLVAKRDGINIPNDYSVLEIEENISSTVLRKDLDKTKLPSSCQEEIFEFYKEKNG